MTKLMPRINGSVEIAESVPEPIGSARVDHDRGDSFVRFAFQSCSLFAPTSTYQQLDATSIEHTRYDDEGDYFSISLVKTMNVSDLLQDSPSQQRKRPSALDGTTSPATTATSSSPPGSQFQSQNAPIVAPQPPQPQSTSTSVSSPRPPPSTANTPYPALPSGPYYSPSPFVPPRIITPRQPPDQPMASLQHPHPHPSWGPRSSSGSSPLVTGSNRAPPLSVGLSSFLLAPMT
jgi:hypothetical protein